ncbi:hypothetical protein EV127DRAFT_436444 [Xylaria flabelliformis]|nr:hypothetical protein EV127DRAFT_436444 [Xylaria flabelliformis]
MTTKQTRRNQASYLSMQYTASELIFLFYIPNIDSYPTKTSLNLEFAPVSVLFMVVFYITLLLSCWLEIPMGVRCLPNLACAGNNTATCVLDILA